MKVSCSGEENITKLFEILQKYQFHKVSIDLDDLDMTEIQKASFIVDLHSNTKEIKVTETKEDDNEEDLDLNQSMSISYGADIKDKISQEVDDKYYIHFYMKNERVKAELIKYCEKCRIDIDFVGEKFVFSGGKKDVYNIIDKINAVKYAKSADIKLENARFIQKTEYLRKLLGKNDAQSRIVPSEKKNLYNIVVYGSSLERIEKCVRIINNVINNIIVIFKLSSKFAQSDETEKITEYLKNFVEKRCATALKKNDIQYEFTLQEYKAASKYAFLLFVACDSSKLGAIRKYVNTEMAHLCFINVVPDKRAGSIPITYEDAEDQVRVVSLADNSKLVIGRANHVGEKLHQIFGSETVSNCIHQFKLRFKKIRYFNEAGEDLSVETFVGNRLQVEYINNDKYVHIFKISNNWKEIRTILRNLFQTLNNSKTKESLQPKKTEEAKEASPIPAPSVSNKILPSDILVMEDQDIIDSENLKKDPSRTDVEENKPRIEFPIENRNDRFFDVNGIDPEDIKVLECDEKEFKKLVQLLKKDYPEADVSDIMKFHRESSWKDYCKSKKENSEEALEEYVMFLESNSDPNLADEYVHDEKTVFFPTINPKKQKCYYDNEAFWIQVAIVLRKASNPIQILNSYVGYIICAK